MNKKNITREEVANRLVSDNFFEKAHPVVTLRQTLVTLTAWTGVLLPFIWLLLPITAPKFAQRIHFRIYLEEIVTFDFLGLFLALAFLLIAVIFLVMTLWNNYHFKHHLRKTPLYNPDEAAVRKDRLETFYASRFGSKDCREAVRFYSVKEEQNFETNSVKEHYQKRGTAL